MRSKFNLSVYSPGLTDATSFYRTFGPLAALRRAVPWLEVRAVEPTTWVSMALSDGVLMQRPYMRQHALIAQMAYHQGIPVWSEFDDNLFEVPNDNPAYARYMNDEAKSVAARVVGLSTFVTVSTQHLYGIFSKLHPRVTLVPNALMSNLIGRIPPAVAEEPPNVVMWRGSETHQRDLNEHTAQIINCAKRHPEFKFAFQGFSTYQLEEGLGNQYVRGVMQQPVEYFGALPNIRPKVLIVPLTDNSFNRGKSNIAWIEATYAGAVCVAPDWPEWQRPGVINYIDRNDFAAKLDYAMELSHADHRALWMKSRGHITNKLDIGIVNAERARIIEKMDRHSSDVEWRDARRREIFAPPKRVMPLDGTKIVENLGHDNQAAPAAE